MVEALRRSGQLSPVGGVQRAVNVLEDDSGLVIATRVDKRDSIVFAIVDAVSVRILRNDQRMTGTDRGLVVKVAAAGLAQIMPIEGRGRIGDRSPHHGVVVAVEDIYFLPAHELQGIDIAGSRFGVGLREKSAQVGKRPRHA